ncbi:D-alanine--D-alanine ligase [Alkalihalobacillus alcalophilus ATCC 27647 = CGMCC 1.3604]|uniref:D-alanine--D-alanine ligase n=1 Tax=Alkalihalobacillus alcalophilus ATCC 27647 = CGMCC 1.3604 TaxID=1218173 RepID=A0A094XKA6_ALKAL|nr:D-alanine--D-alanine ligase [Alkalihalobacillus alcalophilus]KGA99175.1 D-alanine--D-alanine ligase [Alkalihalobacillus alcalophilus ATCC 27647 = CGMCC 1.3604]MED1562499.1 D-alanine--D-alanine ligase [Alkalihalobacillus alcalophilus]THG90639.1 D-alanine--D-alanine ligase [Alkalihalobacillus alcalophilus ATCC 27647 = CGMCC 1.3604]
MKIAVLYGGVSAEREVSLSSGKGIMTALKNKGHEVIGIDFNPNELEEIIQLDVDIVYIGLHGRYGEDGKVQALLDMLKIPYVGSGVQGSALAIDKAKSKLFFNRAGTRIAKEQVLFKHSFKEEDFICDVDYPVVVKPNQEGSTIGITIAEDEETLKNGIKEAFQLDETILLEEFIKGIEVTVAVLGNKGDEKALPVVEIVSKNKHYDYEAKYAAGMSEHIIPARISAEQTEYVQKHAVLAHQVLGCDIYSRVDFIIPEQGDPVILEVNTLPGMTPTSLYPDAAKEIGLDYDEMIEKLITLSLEK